MSRSWSKGSTRAWRRIRARVLALNHEQNKGRCQLAIRRVCKGQADQVHHTLGRAVTGDDMRYLIAACGACNRHVGEPMRNSPTPKRVSRW